MGESAKRMDECRQWEEAGSLADEIERGGLDGFSGSVFSRDAEAKEEAGRVLLSLFAKDERADGRVSPLDAGVRAFENDEGEGLWRVDLFVGGFDAKEFCGRRGVLQPKLVPCKSVAGEPSSCGEVRGKLQKGDGRRDCRCRRVSRLLRLFQNCFERGIRHGGTERGWCRW